MLTQNEIENAVDNFVSKYFDGFAFREHQKEAIISAVDNYQKNVFSQVFSAPTGSGKSLIALITAGVIKELFDEKSYIICSDLSLFQQYVDAIDNYKLPYGYIKGRNEYTCNLNGESINTAVCTSQKISFRQLVSKFRKNNDDCPQGFEDCERNCKYLQDKVKAILAPVTVMTYQFYLTTRDSYSPYTQRELIICDEAHKIPDIIQSQFSLSFGDNFIDDIYNVKEHIINTLDGDAEDFKNYMQKSGGSSLKDLLYEYYPSMNVFREIVDTLIHCDADSTLQLLETLKTLKDKLLRYKFYAESYSDFVSRLMKETQDCKLDKNTKKIWAMCNRLTSYYDDLEMYLQIIEKDEEKDKAIVKQIIYENGSSQSVKLNCLHEDVLCQEFFHNKDTKEILLSATFPTIYTYRENLGLVEPYITDEEFYYHTIPSTFNFENSPIYTTKVCKLSYKEKAVNLPKVIKRIENILKEHSNERGIIQTGSYEFSKALVSKLPKDLKSRLLYYSNSEEKKNVLEKIEHKSNGILIGPSLLEGLDLKDDLCRFIIIMKVPYASLGDALVSAKCKLIKGWYSADAMCKILQGVGRGVRSKNDWCKTYIVDGCFLDLFRMEGKNLPPEFIRRLKFFPDDSEWE